MKKYFYSFIIVVLSFGLTVDSYAGNPDRQGEAGASELLLNPWARSAGVHSLSIASVTGAEAMRLNIAGLGRINKTELVIANTRLYEGSTLQLNAFGFAQKIGESGALGISLVQVDFGEIPITTVNQPGGVGGSYSPGFFHMGLGYAHTYANKISVGILMRGISESLPDVSAFGLALDAGVQYVSGDREEFKLGISLRNIGSPMRFGGEGLSFQGPNPGNGDYQLTFNERAEGFELPSVLNIGLSYDFYFGGDNFVRAMSNFTSNAFSRDQIGVGAEAMFFNKFTLRAAYRLEIGNSTNAEAENVYSGLAAGLSFDMPIRKNTAQRFGIDYAYRATNPFRGTHNFAVRLAF